MAKGCLVFRVCLCDPNNGLSRDDQIVDGCLRRDVLETNAEIIFVKNLSRDLLVAYFLK